MAQQWYSCWAQQRIVRANYTCWFLGWDFWETHSLSSRIYKERPGKWYRWHRLATAGSLRMTPVKKVEQNPKTEATENNKNKETKPGSRQGHLTSGFSPVRHLDFSFIEPLNLQLVPCPLVDICLPWELCYNHFVHMSCFEFSLIFFPFIF